MVPDDTSILIWVRPRRRWGDVLMVDGRSPVFNADGSATVLETEPSSLSIYGDNARRNEQRRHATVWPVSYPSRTGQAEVITQGGAFVFLPEQSAALQFGDQLGADEVEAFGHVRRGHDEAVASTLRKPLLHAVRDAFRGPDL